MARDRPLEPDPGPGRAAIASCGAIRRCAGLRRCDLSALLAGVPDIGGFRSGRDFAAWLGLVPRQNSSGGKERSARIVKMGDRTIRRLLVAGALSVIRWERPRAGVAESWLGRLIARKPLKLAAAALANKMARIVWAALTRGEVYRPG